MNFIGYAPLLIAIAIREFWPWILLMVTGAALTGAAIEHWKRG